MPDEKRWWAMRLHEQKWLIFSPSVARTKLDYLPWGVATSMAAYTAHSRHYKDKLLKLLNKEAEYETGA